MIDELRQIEDEAIQQLETIEDPDRLEAFRISYLGKKGRLTASLKGMGRLSPEERPEAGKAANRVKTRLVDAFEAKKREIEVRSAGVEKEYFDVTLPGRRPVRGHLHPITLATREICRIFERMGFRIVKGPNVELDYYNFEALNIPKDHPARDMQDTFYVSENVVLRTHTSPMQVRVMEKQPPPVAVIAPGKVYRRDSDVTHTPMFHQVEGLLVDEGVTFGDLKGMLTAFARRIFGQDTEVRFRPSFFPFTEPSAEVDIRCVICGGSGCRTCSKTGWLEILGSGMVDPEVYGFVDYDPERVSGFAFGMGIERIAMLKYGIDDIQLFFRNDMRFLRQF
ncbi:MAG: phenylalanine--tRNA ligase subunit alpha [Thermodesulfobacteriota bacterium]